MRTYTEVQDESTGWEPVIRIEDEVGGTRVLVEDVKVWEADRHLVEVFDLMSTTVKRVESLLDDVQDSHRRAAKALTQNVWSKRGGK